MVSACERRPGTPLLVRRVQAAAQALSTVLPIAGQLVLFLVIAGPLAHKVSPSEFFMISIAFSTLLGLLLLLVSSSVEIQAVITAADGIRADRRRRAGTSA